MKCRLAVSLLAVSAAMFAEPPEVLTTTEVSLSEAAQHWGLTETDYRRYQQLMAGQRGWWTPGLDPITALGVSTDSVAERTRLAELFVKTEFERTRKELAFQHAVDDAWQQLFPDTPRLQVSDRGATDAPDGQRTALILRLGSLAGAAHVEKLLSTRAGALDVHVVGTQGNDRALRDWAAGFPALLKALNSGRATLNHGEQFRSALDLPALYRKDGAGQWARVE